MDPPPPKKKPKKKQTNKKPPNKKSVGQFSQVIPPLWCEYMYTGTYALM